jgi:hypothetical protein
MNLKYINKKFLKRIIILLFIFLLLNLYIYKDVLFAGYEFKIKKYYLSYYFLEKFNNKKNNILGIERKIFIDKLNLLLLSKEFVLFEKEVESIDKNYFNDNEYIYFLFIKAEYFLYYKKNIDLAIEEYKKNLIIKPNNFNAKVNLEILLDLKNESKNEEEIENDDLYLKQITEYINNYIKNEGFNDFQKRIKNQSDEKAEKYW